jgi:hypothetical protein
MKLSARPFRSHLFMVAVVLAAGFSSIFSQGFNVGENTDLWRVRGMAQPFGLPPTTGIWHADSLWIGPTFQRDTTKRFVVWLAKYFECKAAYRGKLYLMVPRPGLPDTALFLFRNRCNFPKDSSVDLTDLTPAIHHLDTVYFMYRSDSGTSGPWDCSQGWALPNDYGVKQTDSLFTGPNRAPGEGWTETDRHYSLRDENNLRNLMGQIPAVPDSFFSLNRQKYVKYGRRWCVAGWVHKDTLPLPGSRIRTDTVEFGFEDQFNGSDMSYEDIRFNVSGVIINYPITFDSMVVRMRPDVDTIAAGDSITFRAFVYGKDSLQVPFIDSTTYAQSVAWRLSKSPPSTSFLRRGASPGNTNTFKAVTAYECDTVVASYLRFTKRKAVYVKPGPDYRVWIEPDAAIDAGDASAAMLTRLRNPDSLVTVQLSSLENQATVTGVVRDQFGNFTRFADNAQWTEIREPGVTTAIVSAANGTPPHQGIITRLGLEAGTTNVRVNAKGLQSGADLPWDQVRVTLAAVPLSNLIDDQTFSVTERSTAGTPVGTVALAVPASVNVTLTPVTSVPEFTFEPTTRRITVATGAVLRYATQSSYSFRLAATASNAEDDTATITINLIELTPIANLIDDQSFAVREKSPAGTPVGTVALAVPDSIRVTLSQVQGSAEFSFDPASRRITVAPGALLDWDAKNTFTLRLAAEATNAYALNDTATMTIRLSADSLIPATVTLCDTNHNGHIDRMDIRWTDPSKMKTALPSVNELIGSLSIVTLDNRNDPLQAVNLVAAFASKTIAVIIKENGGGMETGWNSAQINLKPVAVSVKGGHFVVTEVLDGAAPIVVDACFMPGPPRDTLVCTFSEPLAGTQTAGYLSAIKIQSATGLRSLAELGATECGSAAASITYALTAGNMSPYDDRATLSFASGPSCPPVLIDYCRPLPLIFSAKAGPNPFEPNVTIPPGRRGGDPANGIRIEILLNSANTSGELGDTRPARCTIFDAVGNVVLKDALLKPDPASQRKKYFIWDGRNKNGMAVAGGTYLARIQVEDRISGSKVTKRLTLGVKTAK